MPDQGDRLRELESAVHVIDTHQQVHDAEDRLLHQLVRDSLLRIEGKVDSMVSLQDEVRALAKRVDSHSDEDDAPRTHPGVTSGLNRRPGLDNPTSGQGLDNPTSGHGLDNPVTEVGKPRSRWDSPTAAQSLGWGMAVSAFIGPITAAVLGAIATIFGLRTVVPPLPTTEPPAVEVHVETPVIEPSSP